MREESPMRGRAWPSRVPALATEHLRLRAPFLRDATALLNILGNPEFTGYHNVPTLTTAAEATTAK
jgi:RimJ/RimL family protein N-acetyltransferase